MFAPVAFVPLPVSSRDARAFRFLWPKTQHLGRWQGLGKRGVEEFDSTVVGCTTVVGGFLQSATGSPGEA